MIVKVKLPNGAELELENDLSIDQIREVVSSAGLANVAGAPAVEGRNERGQREVTFQPPQGARKG